MLIIVDTNHPVTNKATEMWGIPFQMGILQEESMELSLNLQWIKRNKVTIDQVAEECADTLVSMMSVIPALGIEDAVRKHMENKIARLNSRINDYNGNNKQL
jgi:hypothetical protein